MTDRLPNNRWNDGDGTRNCAAGDFVIPELHIDRVHGESHRLAINLGCYLPVQENDDRIITVMEGNLIDLRRSVIGNMNP